MSTGRRSEKRKRLRARRVAAGEAREALRRALARYAEVCADSWSDPGGFDLHVSRMVSAWSADRCARLFESASESLKPLDPCQGGSGPSSALLPEESRKPLSERVPSARGVALGAGTENIGCRVDRHAAGHAVEGYPVIVLFRPEIPPNAGTIARLCAAFRLKLVLIGPLGFEVTEKSFRRAGLDYWNWVDLDYFDDWQSFRRDPAYSGGRVVCVETSGSVPVDVFAFRRGDLLLFGSETSGLPEWLLDGAVVRIQMDQPHVRSINLANSVAIVASHALSFLRAAKV